MNTVPQLLTDWQQEEIANNTVGGYYKNPVANVTQDIRDTCNTLVVLLTGNANSNISSVYGTTGAINTLFTTINTNSSNIGGFNGAEFVLHTNRLSGVTPLGPSPETGRDVALLPHLDNAMPLGKQLMYLTYQSDGVQNNAPIMGNFTSILIGEDLDDLYLEISTYYSAINNSITYTVYDDGMGNTSVTRTSNLSYSTVSNMSNNISLINTTLAERRVHDEQFYTNSLAVSEQYQQLRKFNSMGASETDLIQNYIGTEKLLTKLNS